MKTIAALGFAFAICAACAAPASAQEADDIPDSALPLLYDPTRPITGREDPQLLVATVSKVLELARKQFAERPRSDVICLGIGHPSADPSAALLQLTRQAMPTIRPFSDCTRRGTLPTHIHSRPDSLLRLESIDRRGRDVARLHASLILGPMSGAGWRCDALQMGAHWIIGPCRLTWTL